MKRDARFDWIRVVAIGVIVLSHYSSNIAGNISGLFVLGSIGNVMFFALSGWLLGLQWRRRGSLPLGGMFLFGRLQRVFPAYALFLVFYVAFLMFVGWEANGWILACNFLFCGWFYPLEGAAHLWFMTALLIFYLLLPLMSRCKRIRWPSGLVALFAIVVAAQAAMAITHIPRAFALSLLFTASIFFLHSDRILELVENKRLRIFLISVAVIWFSVFDAADVMNVIPDSQVCRYWLATASGISLVLAIAALARARVAIITGLSVISFEWYLVHYPLCAGRFALQHWINSPLLVGLVFWVGSIVLAVALHLGVIKLRRFVCQLANHCT